MAAAASNRIRLKVRFGGAISFLVKIIPV